MLARYRNAFPTSPLRRSTSPFASSRLEESGDGRVGQRSTTAECLAHLASRRLFPLPQHAHHVEFGGRGFVGHRASFGADEQRAAPCFDGRALVLTRLLTFVNLLPRRKKTNVNQEVQASHMVSLRSTSNSSHRVRLRRVRAGTRAGAANLSSPPPSVLCESLLWFSFRPLRWRRHRARFERAGRGAPRF